MAAYYYMREDFIRQVVRDTVNAELLGLRNTLNFQVPGMVSTELMTQVPAFLSQNVQMQRILNNHAGQLSQELEATARRHLEKVVRDPDFHEINREFFTAITQKHHEQMDAVKARGNAVIQEIRHDYDDKLSKLTKLTQQLEDSQKELKELRSDLTTLSFLTMVGFASVTIYMVSEYIFKD